MVLTRWTAAAIAALSAAAFTVGLWAFLQDLRLVPARETRMEGAAVVWVDDAGGVRRSPHPDGLLVLLGARPRVWYDPARPEVAVCVSSDPPLSVRGVVLMALAVPLFVGLSTGMLA